MLPKTHRLTARGDFKEVFQGTARTRSGPFQLVCRKNNLQNNRFGFVVGLIVSKKATQRNKLRRRLHGIVQKVFPSLKTGYDCVIRVYPGAADLSFSEIQEHTEALFSKVKIL